MSKKNEEKKPKLFAADRRLVNLIHGRKWTKEELDRLQDIVEKSGKKTSSVILKEISIKRKSLK